MKIDNLKLNFLDNYYMFYDWLENDVIEKNSHVMLYKVSSKVINDFINYKIQLNDIKLINKTKILLFSDGFSYIALEFDNKGKSVYKSSLLLEDELKLNHKVDNLQYTKVNYSRLSNELSSNDLRINDEIRKTITVEIRNLEQNKNIDKLSYLYYEWFNKKENNFDKMIKSMYKKINLPLTDKEKSLYDIIKKSYKLV